MNILVTGGTGTLGGLVVARLDSDHAVRVLSRHPSGNGVAGDLETGEGVDAALEGIDGRPRVPRRREPGSRPRRRPDDVGGVP